MEWNLDNNRPIFIQIVETIQKQIVSDSYQPGQRLPSVRELAAEISVNPNTVQKAFTELERSGVIISKRTAGRFITENEQLIQEAKKEMADEIIEHFLSNMSLLGFSLEKTLELTKKHDYKQEHTGEENE